MSSSYIQKLEESLTLIEKLYSNYPTENKNIDSYFQLINSNSLDIFRFLNYSILSGEYIENEKLKGEIESINPKKIIQSIPVIDSFEIRNIEFQENCHDFVSALTISLQLYSTFIDSVNIDYTSDKIDFLYKFNLKFEREVKKESVTFYKNQLDFLFNNINISYLDLFPNNEIEYFKNLIEAKDSVENSDLSFEDIKEIQNAKINLLMHKWKLRKIEDNPSSIYFFKDGNIDSIEDFDSNHSKIKEWDSYLNNHYQIKSNWKHKIESEVKPFKNKVLGGLKLIQIHQLIKYYKDITKNSEKLKEISKYFIEKDSSNLKNYDKYVFDIITNYAVNNEYSLYLETCKDLDELFLEYKETKEKQKGNALNYFIQFKTLIKGTELFSSDLLKGINYNSIKKYKNIINQFDLILQEYKANKEWSEINYNYIFLLPFDESIIEIENNENISKFFMASSFVLPPEIDKINNQFDFISQKINELKVQVNSIELLKKDLVKIEDLNKELEKRDFKSIEIISIFTAIITFVLSSIPGFKFVEDIHQALLFMLALASSLGIFVILILFSTRGFKNNWIGIIYVVILFIVSFVGFKALEGFEKEKPAIIQKEVKIIMDSVNKKTTYPLNK